MVGPGSRQPPEGARVSGAAPACSRFAALFAARPVVGVTLVGIGPASAAGAGHTAPAPTWGLVLRAADTPSQALLERARRSGIGAVVADPAPTAPRRKH